MEITGSALSLDAAYERVRSPGAGAVVTFVGTTRDVFQGKRVDRLEYECYAPMALKKMRELCVLIRGRWEVERIHIAHRTGTVAVGESSVIIAVSSAHRVASLEATHWCIDELKATVPIWKKEFDARSRGEVGERIRQHADSAHPRRTSKGPASL